NARLHFHAVHRMRPLPIGRVDPNVGRRVPTRRQINSLQTMWSSPYSMPIAVRYTQDALSRSGRSRPVDANAEPLNATTHKGDRAVHGQRRQGFVELLRLFPPAQGAGRRLVAVYARAGGGTPRFTLPAAGPTRSCNGRSSSGPGSCAARTIPGCFRGPARRWR